MRRGACYEICALGNVHVVHCCASMQFVDVAVDLVEIIVENLNDSNVDIGGGSLLIVKNRLFGRKCCIQAQ